MKNKYQTFIAALTLVSVFMFILSLAKVSAGDAMSLDPSYYLFGYVYGAFVWLDVLVFSLLWIVIGLMLFFLKKPIYLLLAFSGFWFIRSLGETFYWFLQQFHPETIPWEQFFRNYGPLSKLTIRETWVFGQMMFQSISVLSLIGIIYSTSKIFKSEK